MADTMSEDGFNDLLETIATRAKNAAAEAEDAGDMAGWMPGTTVKLDAEVALFLVRHIRAFEHRLAEVKADRDALRADLARVSEELGLPPSARPAPGELRSLLADGRYQRARADRMEAALRRVISGVRCCASFTSGASCAECPTPRGAWCVVCGERSKLEKGGA